MKDSIHTCKIITLLNRFCRKIYRQKVLNIRLLQFFGSEFSSCFNNPGWYFSELFGSLVHLLAFNLFFLTVWFHNVKNSFRKCWCSSNSNPFLRHNCNFRELKYIFLPPLKLVGLWVNNHFWVKIIINFPFQCICMYLKTTFTNTAATLY